MSRFEKPKIKISRFEKQKIKKNLSSYRNIVDFEYDDDEDSFDTMKRFSLSPTHNTHTLSLSFTLITRLVPIICRKTKKKGLRNGKR